MKPSRDGRTLKGAFTSGDAPQSRAASRYETPRTISQPGRTSYRPPPSSDVRKPPTSPSTEQSSRELLQGFRSTP
jgi:hypothetical protein